MALHIGIDTGVHTGYAVYDSEAHALLECTTTTITHAMDAVRVLASASPSDVIVYVEDARKRTWFGNTGRERLKGAGSVCRDAQIWEDFCRENNIRCELIAPRENRTKVSAYQFRTIAKWIGRTSEHARDAAMLVYGRE